MTNVNEIISPIDTFKQLTRIESKQDLILSKISTLDNDQDKIEKRLRAVERKMTFWAGGITTASVVLGLASSKIREVFFG